MLQCTFLFLSMQIGHRWTRMYLLEKHMCGTFKNNNSYSPPPPLLFVLVLFPSSFVHSLRATCDRDAGVVPHQLWNYSNEDTMFLLFTALNGDTETRLEYSWYPFLTLALQPPPRSLSSSMWIHWRNVPGHYEKPLMRVWRGVLWCATYYSHSSEPGDTWQADSQQVV